MATDIGIGRATAYNRLDRLIDEQVITGFGARVDPAAAGQGVAALVLINVEQGRWRDLHVRVAQLRGAEWVGVTAGQYDYAMIVRAESLDHLRDVTLQELQQTEGVRSAQTIVLLDEVDRRDEPDLWLARDLPLCIVRMQQRVRLRLQPRRRWSGR